jgi:DNA-binding GntR family transcriptional regulator
MSLLPISDALQRLEGEGLIQTIPRVGTRVFDPSERDIREIYVVREALETQAARLCCEKASARERDDLLRMAEQTDAVFNRSASGENDPEFLHAVHAYHLDLHMRIAECSGCRLLVDMVENSHVLIFNWLYDVAAKGPPLAPRFHRDLVAVLTGSDPSAAAAAMRQHVYFGLNNILHALEPSSLSMGVTR